jgi:hypothetical protein
LLIADFVRCRQYGVFVVMAALLCRRCRCAVLSSLQLLKTFVLAGSGHIVIVVSTSPSSKVEDWKAEMCGGCIDHLRCGNGGWQR